LKVVVFCHSLISDWNHGNAHFLRGVASELIERGHEVAIFEPEDAWSLQNLIHDHGEVPVQGFHQAYPNLSSVRFRSDRLDLTDALAGAELVIVHEWNEPDLVARLGKHRREDGEYLLLFHDTHHRSVSQPDAMAAYDLAGYDGVLAFGRIIRDLYLRNGWARKAWVWHEAADTRIFQPILSPEKEGDVVWIGNWGDEERTAELHEFLLSPIRELGLKAKVYGVRYPPNAIDALERHGIEYGGYLPNYRVPEVFSRYSLTVHVPRRPYVESLPGIPTIRPFESMACGIPLVCSPWHDSEHLFSPGQDYLIANDGEEMKAHMRMLLEKPARGLELAEHARQTILSRHTCRHRVDQLLDIVRQETSQVSGLEVGV